MKIPTLEIKNRHQAVFVISAATIGGLFVVAIIAILTGKFAPFADEATQPTPRQTITLGQATVSFKDSLDAARQVVSNTTQLTIAPYPSLEATRIQGLPSDKLATETLAGSVSYKKVVNGQPQDLVPSTNWNATHTTNRLQSELRAPAITNPLDQLQGTYSLSVLVRPENSLAIRVDNVTNYEAPILVNAVKPIIPADFNQTGTSNNKIDSADIDAWKADFGKTGTDVATTLKKKDFNRDGKIDEADYSLIFSEYYNRVGDSL